MLPEPLILSVKVVIQNPAVVIHPQVVCSTDLRAIHDELRRFLVRGPAERDVNLHTTLGRQSTSRNAPSTCNGIAWTSYPRASINTISACSDEPARVR